MRVQRDWHFEAFVNVKILGAGDDLLRSAAGKPRYVVYSSRVCVLRIAALHTCKKRPRGAACPGRCARSFFFFSVRVLQPSRFGYTGANGNIPLSEAPNLPVRRQQQPSTSNHHILRIRLVSLHPHEANEQIRRIIWRGGECKSGTARPTKHTKFKTNELATQASSA